MAFKTAQRNGELDPSALIRQSRSATRASRPRPTDLALRLVGVLQTTLDSTRLLELFAGEIGRAVAVDSVYYVNEEHGIYYLTGQVARHSCRYRLVIQDQAFGEITFTRHRKFSAHELMVLELLLCGLVYPLRNALTHKAAVEEARRDPLSGVYNRGVLDAALRREVALAHRHGFPFSLIFIDIDRFKAINDAHGHTVGDRAIRAFVECVERCVRVSDMLGRYGGDEFVLLLSNTPLDGALLLADRIRAAVSQAACLEEPGLRLTASFGVGSLRPGEDGDTLLDRVDHALREAKRAGRNRVHADPWERVGGRDSGPVDTAP